MNLTDSRLPQSGCEKLELSFLNFFEQFRKIYIGEQVLGNSKTRVPLRRGVKSVYCDIDFVILTGAQNIESLQKTAGCTRYRWRKFSFKRIHEKNVRYSILALITRVFVEDSSVWCMVVCRITNLKYWGGSEQTISKTLSLLNDLCVGYMCVRKMVKLEEVIFLLSSHTVSWTFFDLIIHSRVWETVWISRHDWTDSCDLTLVGWKNLSVVTLLNLNRGSRVEVCIEVALK